MITFQVEDSHGSVKLIEIPDGIKLNLMEVLKASEYSIPAALPPASDNELDMIDTLPNATSCSRLACQIQVTEDIQDALFCVMSDEQ